MKGFIVKKRILILLFAVMLLAEGFCINAQNPGGDYEGAHSHKESFGEAQVSSDEIIPERTDCVSIENLRLASSVQKTYTIKYNANGGSGSMSNQIITYGVSTATRANAFTRSSYTFKGWTAYRASDKKWYCGNDGWRTAAEISSKGYKKYVYSNKSTVSKTTAVNKDTVTFYAEWNKNTSSKKYTIKYNANGGSGSMADQTITYGVSTATRANAFARSCYTEV